MTVSGTITFTYRLAFLVLLSTLVTSCDKKAQVKHETEQAFIRADELKTQLKKIEADILGVGPLGRYHYSQKSHLNELRGQIEVHKKEISSLKTEREAAKQKAELAQKEVEAYWAKY